MASVPRYVICGAVAASVLTGNLQAIQANTCQVIMDHVGGSGQQIELSGGRLRYHLGGGVRAHCLGELTRMESDSVAGYSDLQRVDFFRNVVFVDTNVTLTSDRAIYYLDDERLHAFGNVVLTNMVTGSTLSGPNLTYSRAVRGIRDSVEIFATGRPTVEYHAAGESSSEPYLIEGDRIRFEGNSKVWMGGAVEITRSDLHARSDSAFLDIEASEGELIGNAVVRGRDSSSYRLSSKTLRYRFGGSELEWIQARDSAHAESSDWVVDADTIELAMDGGLIQSAVAWGDSLLPVASSAEYTITSDSLEIDSPDQVLEELRAFGHAIARSVSAQDSVEADWIAGDTLIVTFKSGVTGNRVIDALDAQGEARALYAVYGQDTSGNPGFNYSRGDRIVARFAEGEIDRIDVFGEADGVYLEPQSAR